MNIELPDLPFDVDSLEPYISAETVKYHYLKHHKGYVDKAKKFIAGTSLADLSVEEIISKTREDDNAKKIYNSTAQIWNHNLYWHSMKKHGGGSPEGALLAQIEKDFNTLEKFQEEFKKCGLAEFGSGYVWLLFLEGKLRIISDTDAKIPVQDLNQAILNMDVWEHAYYIDYRNERGKYIDIFLKYLINWDHAASRFNSLIN